MGKSSYTPKTSLLQLLLGNHFLLTDKSYYCLNMLGTWVSSFSHMLLQKCIRWGIKAPSLKWKLPHSWST